MKVYWWLWNGIKILSTLTIKKHRCQKSGGEDREMEGRMGEVKDSPGCGESSPQGEGETVSLETEMSYSASSHLL